MRLALHGIASLLVLAHLSGCAGGPRSALMARDLANAEYRFDWTRPGSIELRDGFYWQRGVPRSLVELRVILAREAVGELNGDDASDAAVVLAVTPEDSGLFWYLAAMLNEGGRPRNASTVLLGDRIEVREVVIRDRQIRVKVLPLEWPAPNGFERREEWWTYRLEGEELVRVE